MLIGIKIVNVIDTEDNDMSIFSNLIDITQGAERHAYSIAEICQATGLSDDLIRKENKDGRLPFRKAGARTVVLAKDYMAWLGSLPVISGPQQ
jgi:hypothetical protein